MFEAPFVMKGKVKDNGVTAMVVFGSSVTIFTQKKLKKNYSTNVLFAIIAFRQLNGSQPAIVGHRWIFPCPSKSRETEFEMNTDTRNCERQITFGPPLASGNKVSIYKIQSNCSERVLLINNLYEIKSNC